MSDSDDTDFLLLIPPDYFTPESHAMEDLTDAPAPAPTAAYQFLQPQRKAELNEINARLHNIERNALEDYHFAAPSDISTISNCTVRTRFGRKQEQHAGLAHSTPKCANGKVRQKQDIGMLYEIDHFLEDRQLYDSDFLRHSDDFRYQQHCADTIEAHVMPAASSLPDALNCEEAAVTQQQQFKTPVAAKALDSNLISLSEIWGKSGQQTAISTAAMPSTNLKEEQLRRQHLEKTVHMLQARLLEYQQRLSVAIEVDRTKDAALHKAKLESSSLNGELQQMRESFYKLENEQKQYNTKMDEIQKELAQAVNLATKFQDKNEKLEAELATSTRRTNECNHIYKEQLEELEIKLHASKRSEEYANNELHKLKDKLAKAEYQNEKLKVRSDELEKDCTTLRHQKEMLQEFHQKQKAKADAMETQKKSLQSTLQNLTENETNLKKKLELQQKSLKAHYQQQLEQVVAQKLKEFQEQLDRTEETLKREAHERERLLAERAVKQLELINEKSDLELNLLQEKHNEEVDLYRIQLANASKKIDALETKLHGYKSKRADIAEKLHGVMETQWQKALEILTSPNNHTRTTIPTDTEADSPEQNLTHAPQSAQFETTPKTSKNSKENNLNVENGKTVPPPKDRLQAYIELLLSKSPSDFDKLDQILALSAKSKSSADKLNRSGKRYSNGKPPWKA